jgi:single-stranded DNA-binding protein
MLKKGGSTNIPTQTASMQFGQPNIMINKVIIEGKLIQDPKIIKITPEKEIIRMVIIHKRHNYENNKEEAYFFEIDVYSPNLVNKVKKLKKDDKIIAIGELKQERWTQNNEKRSKIRIKAAGIRLPKPKSKEKQKSFAFALA